MATGSPPRFLVDAMLGNVARDLRLLGFDTVYAGSLTDAEILHRCQAEGRILVTRDRALAARAGAIPALLVGATSPGAQTAEALRALGGEVSPRPRPRSRCLECNGSLRSVRPEAAGPHVPDHVALTQDRFWECPDCRRIYWRGSHWRRLEGRLHRLEQTLQAEGRRV